MAEWLRRWTANPLGSARVGSNPIFVVIHYSFFLFSPSHFQNDRQCTTHVSTSILCSIHSHLFFSLFFSPFIPGVFFSSSLSVLHMEGTSVRAPFLPTHSASTPARRVFGCELLTSRRATAVGQLALACRRIVNTLTSSWATQSLGTGLYWARSRRWSMQAQITKGSRTETFKTAACQLVLFTCLCPVIADT